MNSQDVFVKIELGGETLLFDKVGDDASEAMGMRQDAACTYYIDGVRPPAAP